MNELNKQIDTLQLENNLQKISELTDENEELKKRIKTLKMEH